MANYGKYYIAARILLLRQYLETNAGIDRYVKRSELERFLREEHDISVEKKTLYADFAVLDPVRCAGMDKEGNIVIGTGNEQGYQINYTFTEA